MNQIAKRGRKPKHLSNETDKSNGNETTKPIETPKTEDKEQVKRELGGKEIIALNVFHLANVEVGAFPFSVLLDNKTISSVVFPELGLSLPPYAKDIQVIFSNQSQLDAFVQNVQLWANLWDWNVHFGVVVKGNKHGTNDL